MNEIGLAGIEGNLRQHAVLLAHQILGIGLQRLIFLEVGRRTPPAAASIRNLCLLQQLRLRNAM